MTREFEAELTKLSKGFFPPDLWYSVGEGWNEILRAVAAFSGQHLGRWREVKEIELRTLKSLYLTKLEPSHWISQYFEANPTDPLETTRVVQVKEKFGGLRIYYNGQDDYIDGLISMASFIASVTCETCGKPGEKVSPPETGCIQTLCPEHATEWFSAVKREFNQS